MFDFEFLHSGRPICFKKSGIYSALDRDSGCVRADEDERARVWLDVFGGCCSRLVLHISKCFHIRNVSEC